MTVTWVLVIAAALQLGLQGAFGIDAIGWAFGGYAYMVNCVIGVAGVWQLIRTLLIEVNA
jgi:uncharacterized membrane protein YuzA (DUF378 family)